MLSYFILFILYHIPRRILRLSEKKISNFTTNKLVYLCYCVYISRRRKNSFIPPSWKKISQKTIINVYGNDGAGLTDRIHGMVATHIYCNNKGFNHKIFHKTPFDLERYFQPNIYDWHLPENESHFDSKNSIYLQMPSLRDKTCMDYVLNLYTNLFGLKRLFLNICLGVDEKSYHYVFNQLFKPSEYLSKLFNDAFFQQIEHPYISASFRFCNLLGDSNTNYLNPLDLGLKKLLLSCCKKQIDMLRKCNDATIVITSDSPSFLKCISGEKNTFCFNEVLIKGQISKQNHMGFCSQLTGYESDKIFLEFLCISKAKTAYQIKIGPMYASRFPEYAAIAGGVPYQLLEYAL